MNGAATWRSSCENELAVSTSFIAGRKRTTTRTRSPSADAPRGEGSCLVLRRLRGGLGSFVGVARFGLDARGVLLRFGEAARISSFYISYRGFYSATRPPVAPHDPGSPSQATWVGEDRTWPPCPRSDRSAPRTLAHRAPWGARKRRRPGSSNDTRPDPPACSTAPERPRMDMGPAQRQPCGP